MSLKMGYLNNKGTALTELAIALIFIVPLLFGLIDFSIMISNYQKLEQAVREGVRTSTRFRDMTTEFCFSDHDLNITNPGTSDINAVYCDENRGTINTSTLDCQHALIQSRVRRVVSHQILTNFSADPPEINENVASANINSVFCPPTSSSTNVIPCNGIDVDCRGINQDSIHILVSGRYEGCFGDCPLSASYQGPWLYQNVSSSGAN